MYVICSHKWKRLFDCCRTKEEQLTVNPSKTVMVPFTRKRWPKEILAPKRFGKRIQVEIEFQDLGVTLDSKLTWNPHLNRIIRKAQIALVISRRTFGKSWGLSPKMSQWLYTAVI